MKKDIVTIHKNIEHPLEDVFDIEPGTTLIERQEQRTEMVAAIEYDDMDNEIEEQMQEVYDKAMSGYGIIQDECEDIEGKYKARMMEVGVQHLKMALDAVNSKARMKETKDKLKGKAGAGPKTVNNNLFINREELLKSLIVNDDEGNGS